ncbi:MAG: cytochrome b N-terminal domain-containing protein [Proteobacteria bacterium]|nr:cytochrome b N-terminal domain-containing protein [Pseudomonadota bacterium]
MATQAAGRWLARKRVGARVVGREIMTGRTLAPRRWTDWLSYTGTATVALAVLQFATGLLLFLYYRPHPARAFESWSLIRGEVPFGLLISGLHSAGSKLLILAAMIHLLRVLYTGAFRGPRAGTWYTGVALLTAMMLSGFSGYLLPWGQQSFWACVVGTEAAGAVPLAGRGLVHALRGGQDVGGATLARFYFFHVFLLPFVVGGLLWWHVKRVWRVGVSAPAEAVVWVDAEKCAPCGACEKVCPFRAARVTGRKKEGGRAVVSPDACNACRACLEKCPAKALTLVADGLPVPTEPIFPHNVLHRSAVVLGTLSILFAGVYFFRDLAVGGKVPADPLLTPDRIKPDWYFLAPYQVLKILPSERWGLFALLAAFGFILFLPVLDKNGPRDPRKRPVFVRAFWAGVAVFVVLTLWGLWS